MALDGHGAACRSAQGRIRTMHARVIACFLAIILLWSGLATIEAPRGFVQAPPAQDHAIADACEPTAGHGGSVEHHHLDDLPSQAQSDPPTETPGLLSAPLKHGVPPLAIVRPLAFVSATPGAPFLAGPLRPPCDAATTG